MNYLIRISIAMATLAATPSFSQNISQQYVEKTAHKAIARFDLPALSVTMMNKEDIYVHAIEGVRKINSNDKAGIEDYFHIGSCSKSVLAVIAGKLNDQGNISWHSKFFDLFPEMKQNANPEYYQITLEDLFTCEAAIKPYTTSEELFPPIDSSAANKRYAFAQWLLAQPASQKRKPTGKFEHLYSNASYTLAALMLEKSSGLSWEELVTGMMTELGLKVSFGFPVSRGTQQPWGHGYFDYDPEKHAGIERKTLRPFGPGDPYQINELIAPAGDLSMTTMDYARYTQMHLQGLTDSNAYLKKETWDYIHFSRKGFSIGVANAVYFKRQITGFDGSAGTFYCRSIIVPSDDVAFTIMTNTGSQKAIDWLTLKIAKKFYRWWWKFWM